MQTLSESGPAWGLPGSIADELLRRAAAESRRLDDSPRPDASIAAVYEMLFGQPHIHAVMDDTTTTIKNAMDSGNLLADATKLDPEGQGIYEMAFEGLFHVPAIPVTIGPYRILHRHASGGAGTVYVGIHLKLKRMDAIKLAHPRIQGPVGNDKLIEEAKALAKVHSQHVVQVYDCGECKPGDDVYIAMQFLSGTTLGKWQQKQPRPWRDLLARYLRAGQGLADIHTAGLLHRDFKPDNVLITDRDEVKIVDFGLACAADDDPTTASAGGTPRFMAPERLFDRAYDHRSDQFSFCVALFEALFGRHPFAETAPSSQSRRATQPSRATRPNSTQPATAMPDAASLSFENLKLRLATGLPPERPPTGAVPGRIYRALVRGLAHDPAKRFPTMQALLTELGRDPLRKSAPYIALGVLGAVAGGYLMTRPAPVIPCENLEAELTSVWNDARREQLRTAFTATGSPHAPLAFTQVERSLDRFIKQWHALRQGTCQATHLYGTQSVELENLTMACLDRARSGTTAVVDRLERADADTVLNVIDKLAELPDLADCSEQRIRRQRCLDSGAYPDVPEIRTAINEARALEIASQFSAAEAAARAAVAAAKAHDNRALEAETQFTLARILAEQSDHNPAAQVFADAYRLAEAAECDALAADINNARTKLFSLSTDLDPDEGRSYAEISFAKVERLHDSGLQLAEAHNNLGLLLVSQGKPAEALPHHEEALKIRTDVAGPLPTPDVALSHLNIGSTHAKLGAHDAAITSFNRALTEFKNVYGDGHPRLWKVHVNLANAWLEKGDYKAVIAEAELARPLIERSFGPRHRKVAVLENLLAAAALDEERFADAKRHAELADEIYAEVLPPGDIARLDSLRYRGYAYNGLGDHAAAITVRMQTWALADASTRTEAALELAESLTLGKRPGEARRRCDDVAAAIAVNPEQFDRDFHTDFTELCAPAKSPSPTSKHPHGDQ